MAMNELSNLIDSGIYVPLKDRKFSMPRDAELVGVSHFILRVRATIEQEITYGQRDFAASNVPRYHQQHCDCRWIRRKAAWNFECYIISLQRQLWFMIFVAGILSVIFWWRYWGYDQSGPIHNVCLHFFLFYNLWRNCCIVWVSIWMRWTDFHLACQITATANFSFLVNVRPWCPKLFVNACNSDRFSKPS